MSQYPSAPPAFAEYPARPPPEFGGPPYGGPPYGGPPYGGPPYGGYPPMPGQEFSMRPTHEFPAMPAMQMPPPVICQAAPAMTVPMVFGPRSISMTCPHCNCMIQTETSKTHTCCSHLCCVLLFCSGALTLCSCLPYFMCDPDSVEHTCSNCHVKLGEWHS